MNLLKRKVFNPHKCNIAGDPYSEMPYKERRRVYHNRQVQCGNFALLYAFLTNWIKDEDMTIMECYAIYQRF
ncbi:MAG: hypothetical protein HFJ29_09640 [Clostridia bacterium]|nr:hypothetical protein [Clostridia bacterium]